MGNPSGEFNGSSLVWKEGMQAWTRAESVTEFAGVFPPAI
ncbi:MAG: DUF4339 domain-containing protein [Bacilli bacterium]|nr:DUF4339 domain-containing protein [Bacilli bacterium]